MALQASLSWETFEQYAFWQVSVNFGTLKNTACIVRGHSRRLFLDVFPQLSPTQVSETLSFSKKILEFFKKNP